MNGVVVAKVARATKDVGANEDVSANDVVVAICIATTPNAVGATCEGPIVELATNNVSKRNAWKPKLRNQVGK